MSAVIVGLLAMSALAIEIAIVHILERRWLLARGERQKLRSQVSTQNSEARPWVELVRPG